MSLLFVYLATLLTITLMLVAIVTGVVLLVGLLAVFGSDNPKDFALGVGLIILAVLLSSGIVNLVAYLIPILRSKGWLP